MAKKQEQIDVRHYDVIVAPHITEKATLISTTNGMPRTPTAARIRMPIGCSTHARLAWLCDTCGLPPDTDDFLTGQRIDELVIDCNDAPRAAVCNHNDVTRALHIVARLAPRQAWLVHLSQEMDNWLLDNGLPENVSVPFDGQQIAVGLRDAVTV